MTIVYTYDESGKLLTRSSTTSDENSVETSIYDAQGRLEKKDEVVTYNYKASYPSRRYITTYAYDSNDRMTQSKLYSSTSKEPVFPTNFTLDDFYEYAYSGSSRLPTKVTVKKNTGWQFDPTFYYVDEFTYTDGNVTTLTYTDMPTRLNQYTSSTNVEYFQYDNKPNPYFGIDSYTPYRNFFYYCRNNPIIKDVTYTYDERGLLIRSDEVNGDRRDYEYEMY